MGLVEQFTKKRNPAGNAPAGPLVLRLIARAGLL